MTLTKETILLMNATIIAGLLILLTLQYSSTVSIEDLVMKNSALETEIISLAIMVENTTDNNFKEKIENRIDDLKLELESVRSELTVNAKIPWLLYARTNPWVISSAFILPFLTSSAMILLRDLGKKELPIIIQNGQ